MIKDAPILIVGQGIAGTMLAWELEKRRIFFYVMDPGSSRSASATSSGLINPITGRRYNKSWRFDEFFPIARESYRALEDHLDQRFFHHINIARNLAGPREENDWYAKCENPDMNTYMSPSYLGPDYSDHLRDCSQFGTVLQGHRLDTQILLQTFRHHLRVQDRLIEANFQYDQLALDRDHLTYQGQPFSHIIFAEGWKVRENPFFGHLAWQPAKGEVLICRIPSFPESAVVKFKKFLVPLGNDLFWIGSTYQWSFENDLPDKAKAAELRDYLHQSLIPSHTVVDHLSGVRPATKYRRPYVGTHPKYKRLHILNGLGTKGISLAPYWAHYLVRQIIDGPLAFPVDPDLPVIV